MASGMVVRRRGSSAFDTLHCFENVGAGLSVDDHCTEARRRSKPILRASCTPFDTVAMSDNRSAARRSSSSPPAAGIQPPFGLIVGADLPLPVTDFDHPLTD